MGEVGAIVPLAGAHQRRHRKLVVDTAAGRFLVKTYKRELSILDALTFQHRLSHHLDAHGLPVARILPTRRGKTLLEDDNWAMELQQFIEAEPMPMNTETLTATARALGKFHQVCRDLPCPPRDARMWRFSEVPRNAFQQFYTQAQQTGAPNAEQACNEIALFLHEAAKELDAGKRSTFETGLIHGDWHSGNLMFRGHNLVAIVDLEFAGDGCYLEDIAYACSNLCVRTTDSPEKLTWRFNVLLDNYQYSRTLSYAERFALYYAVGIKHIMTVSYQFIQRKGAPVAGFGAAEWLGKLAAQCRWLRIRAERARFGE